MMFKKNIFGLLGLFLITTTVCPYIVEIKTTRIGNKRIIIFSDKHSDLIENGRSTPAKQVAQNQRNALKLAFNQYIYHNPAQCYIEVDPDMTKGILSISSEEAQEILRTGDYFDIFYVNFVRGVNKEQFKTVDLASWQQESTLELIRKFQPF